MSDDLTRIKDISFARQKWLNQQGIHTYAELAGGDPNWIYQQFIHENQLLPISLELVRCWVKEAKDLEALLPLESPTNTTSNQPENRLSLTEGGWGEFASFYVSYQHKRQVEDDALRTQVVYRTYVDHIEANENRQWEGIEGDNLWRWITSHVDSLTKNGNRSEASPLLFDEVPTLITLPTKPGEIRVVGIQVSDPMGGSACACVGEFFKGAVHSQQPLTFNFSLEYLAADSKNMKDMGVGECKISLYIYDMPGDSLILKSQEISRQMPESGQPYCFETVVALGVQAGLYRIRVVTALVNQTPVLSVTDIPLLQII